jgi:hypothetical protein
MRGFVFSIMALLIVSVLVLFATTDQQPDLSSRSAIPEVREMNAIITDIETDIGRGLYITSFRALLAQIEYLIRNGELLTSTEDAFNEAMLNGTINGQAMNTLDEADFALWLEKIEAILAQRGFSFTYEVLSLEQYHSDPTTVASDVTLTYTLADSGGKRNYTRTITSTAHVPLEGLEDPLYFVKGLGRLSNVVRFTNETDLIALIDESANNSLYRASDKSPSYLMRLEGDFSASEHGIESIVNGHRFEVQGITLYDGRSSIDALYFSSIGHTPQCMSGTPEWFRLDTGRLGDYTGSTNITC